MKDVLTIRLSETVRLDRDRLGALAAELGDAAAEDVVCRAMEELALRMSLCNQLYQQRDWDALAKTARSLIAIADQIGMTALARVATDVTTSAEGGDPVATGATLARLLRIGEYSLTNLWELQDITI